MPRPRRFGKSLFLDTCKELFEGNEPLFEGLAIHDRWDWSVRHPVLRLSFGSGHFKEPGQLALSFKEQLAAAERRAGVVTDYDTAPGRFAFLLEALHRQSDQPVAVLVDEYDKPILDALDVPEVARANRGSQAGTNDFDKTTIEKLLEELNDKLAERDLYGEIYVVGGAALILEYGANRRTNDIDCAIHQEPEAIHAAAAEIAHEQAGCRRTG